MTDVFIVLTGAYGNVGDGVIRRRVLQWVRGAGEIHAYVGNAPEDWVEQLGLNGDVEIYSAARSWKWVRTLMFGRGRRALVFDPGQVPLGKGARRAEAYYLALTLWTRLRGGVVIRPPRAFAGTLDPVAFRLHRAGARASNVALWRTPRCETAIGVGEFCPDTAFQEPFEAGSPMVERKRIVVSMRGKRALPSAAWFDSVKKLAVHSGGDVLILSQVREDEVRSNEITERLRISGVGADMLEWGENSDLEQEDVVRAEYARARFVVSDRLHVLILAAKAGAIPLEYTDHHPSKADEHFAAIGYRGVSSLVAEGDSAGAVEHAIAAEQRIDELQGLMQTAFASISDRVIEIEQLVSRTSASELMSVA